MYFENEQATHEKDEILHITHSSLIASRLHCPDNSKANAIPHFSRPRGLTSRAAGFNQGRYAELELCHYF